MIYEFDPRKERFAVEIGISGKLERLDKIPRPKVGERVAMAINWSVFDYTKNFNGYGEIEQDGKQIQAVSTMFPSMSFKDNKLTFGDVKGAQVGVGVAMTLVLNGKIDIRNPAKMSTGVNKRTACGQKANGNILFVTVDSMTTQELAEYMIKQGCFNAFQGDSGGSTGYFNGVSLSDQGRAIAGALVAYRNMGIRASELIKWCKSKVGLGYVYGAIGQTCTLALLKQLEKQYGAAMGNGYYQLNGDYTKGRCGKWWGKWVADCSGLIKAGRKALDGTWKDVSAQGTYDQCTKRGTIKDMSLIPGCTVYMYSTEKKRMGHVGIYIGAGLVVEARGADPGIVTTKLYERVWSYWGLLDWLDYDLPAEKPSTVIRAYIATKDAGDATNPKPDDKAPIMTAKEFQKAMGLKDDGIVGPITLAKMQEVKILLNKYVKG